MGIDVKTLALARKASNNGSTVITNNSSIVPEWKYGDKYSKSQLLSYDGKLYKALNDINKAVNTPDQDTTNYKVYTSTGGSVSGSIEIPGFTAKFNYSYGDLIIYNNTLLMAKKNFTSAALYNFNDWIIISDMLKSVYDTNNNGKVDFAESSDIAFLSYETSILQAWKPNKSYLIGQNVIYKNEIYIATTDFSSGATFDKTNLKLIATGDHNRMNNVQGGDSSSGQYYHLTQDKYNVVNKLIDSAGDLSFNGNPVGDMKKSIYDTNNDGIVDKASTLSGLNATVSELNFLHGATSNIQSQINAISSIGNFLGSVATYAAITTDFPSPSQKDMVIVITDETKNGATSIYLYNGTVWTYSGAFTANIRDFSINPLNVTSESIGIYEESRIDPLIARKTDIVNLPNATLLSTYTHSDQDIDNAIVNQHNHTNIALLNSYNQTNADITDAVTKKHDHTNQSILNKFSEDSSGNPLYNGSSIVGTSGGGGITNLSAFNTSDLPDTINFRYVTDTEKSNLANLTTIAATQTAINNTLTTLMSELPGDVSPSNKLITSTTVDTKINNIKFATLSDVDKTVKPNSFLVTNATGNQVTYMTSIKPLIKVQQVTDKDGVDFFDVPKFKFNNLKGVQDSSGQLTLTLQDMFSINLLDMPASYESGKVLVSNAKLMKYELRSIADITNSKENYEKIIGQTDWTYDSTLEKYTVVVEHLLNSKNLIVGFYNAANFNVNDIIWGLLDGNSPDKIILEAATNDPIRVIINCSQGAVGDGTGTGSGNASVTMSDFLDDTRARIDKAYSSSKITDILGTYAQKSIVYSKSEANVLFSSKINEHIHSNISALCKISEDLDGNMYYGDKKILTDLQPFTYQKKWIGQNYVSSTLLLDVNTVFNTNSYNAILDSELVIKNDILSTNQTEDAKLVNQVHLVVLDDTLSVLDVYIPPQSTQKYILGISPNLKIMVNGKFTSNYYLTAY